MLNGEATNAIFIVFGLTQPGLAQMIYRTRDEHAYQWPKEQTMIYKTLHRTQRMEQH
jgi:hypothetical protein